MKKTTAIAICILIGFSSACTKKDDEKKGETPIAKKYAKYERNVYRDRDLRERIATLAKAEGVELLEEEKYLTKKKETIVLSRIKLADDTTGYIESRHLADRPIVFTGDTKVYIRPTPGSAVHATVPKGTIGFVTAEKGSWAKVYIGKIDGKWITEQWIEGGYSTDVKLLQEAKEYESACGLIESKNIEKAKEKLTKLSGGSSVIAELARIKIEELDKKSAEEPAKKQEEKIRSGEKELPTDSTEKGDEKVDENK